MTVPAVGRYTSSLTLELESLYKVAGGILEQNRPTRAAEILTPFDLPGKPGQSHHGSMEIRIAILTLLLGLATWSLYRLVVALREPE